MKWDKIQFVHIKSQIPVLPVLQVICLLCENFKVPQLGYFIKSALINFNSHKSSGFLKLRDRKVGSNCKWFYMYRIN